MKKLTKLWLIISAPLTLLGLYALFMMASGTGHPHPRYDFGGEVNWANMPRWDVTNSPPLSIEEAVRIGREFLTDQATPDGEWRMESVGLGEDNHGQWIYELGFRDSAGKRKAELLRVLMNGQVARMKWSDDTPTR